MQQDSLTIRAQVDHSLEEWREQEKKAIDLQKISGELRFDKNIQLVLFRKDLYDVRPSEVIKNHNFAHHYASHKLDISTSLLLASAIKNLKDLAPSKIDIGKLGLEWNEESSNFNNVDEFLHYKLRNFINAEAPIKNHCDIILYGFGRIGRLAARMIISNTGKGEQLRLKAIVIRPKLKDRYEEARKRASLLKSDTVHGEFSGLVEVAKDGEELFINGNRVKLIYANKPEDIDYTEYGIKNALVIDNTGVWRDREGLQNHVRPGVKKVVLTAPAKGDIPNIVYGVNEGNFDRDEHTIYSAASCTTNAIVPVLKIIKDQFGIEKGHIETIHSYTNDQNLLDNFHKKPRRGKGASTNMVITTTGAADAVSKVFPEMKGILSGNSIRVPTPNVSIAILNVTLKSATNANELNAKIKEASLFGGFIEQIQYSNSTEYCSSNAIGSNTTSVVDAPSTKVSADGKSAVIYLWYDNEYGYTAQVVRLCKHLAKVRRYVYY